MNTIKIRVSGFKLYLWFFITFATVWVVFIVVDLNKELAVGYIIFDLVMLGGLRLLCVVRVALP